MQKYIKKRVKCENDRGTVVRDVSRVSFLTLRPKRPLCEEKNHQYTSTVTSAFLTQRHPDIYTYIISHNRESVCPHRESSGSGRSDPVTGVSGFSSRPVTAVQSRGSSSPVQTGVTLQRKRGLELHLEHELGFLALYTLTA